MVEPKQIIENIRKIRFGKGLDITNLTEEQKQALRDKEKILKDASNIAREIHTKNPHFIFELIQNAEDNEYKEGVIPEIKFILKPDLLIIQNNEKGFKEENVWALCGIGESTKRKTIGYIGEKGIGFKSTFMVANKVQIYSNGFQFEFNYNEADPVTMIIPEWIDEIPDFIDPNQTNVVLYIKPEIKNEINNYIGQIHPSLLLFLRKLKVIEVEDMISVRKMEKYEKNGLIEIIDDERKSYWKVVRKKLEVDPNINEERRRGVRETEIILAFPLNNDGTSDTSNNQYVFAFLPVRQYGFKFIIQADFLLPITREDIIKDNKWNLWLRDSITEVFLYAIDEFKDNDKLKYDFYGYLPLNNEVKDEFFSPLLEQIYTRLKEEECILTESNRWRKPSEVLIGDEDIKKIVSNEDLQKFLKKEYLSERIKAKKPILKKLGVMDFSIRDLIKCLEETEWIKKRNDKWFVNLFRYLSKKNLTEGQLEQIKNLSIIKLENGELTSINDGLIFFPLEKEVTYGFEDELRVIKKDIMDAISEQEKEEKDKILEFLKRLGLKQADSYEIIENHILPIYDGEEWKQKDSRTLIGYIRYIKDNIDKYEKESDKRLNANKESERTKDDPLKRLKKSLLIRINKDEGGEEEYRNPENIIIYLPKIYGNENNLEDLFEGIDVSFVHRCYIEEDIKQIESRISKLKNTLKNKSKKWKKTHKKDVKKIEEKIKKLENRKNKKIEEWRDFFLKLDVDDTPKVVYYDDRLSDGEKYPTREEREYSTWYRDRDHKVKDWRVPTEFENVLNSKDTRKIKILLKILDDYWDTKYSKCLKMDYQWFYYRRQHKSLPSSFIRELKEKIKVPTTQGTSAKPSEVFLNEQEIRDVLGDTVPYLAVEIRNKDFIETIGINTEANVESVLNYLKALVEQKTEDKEKYEKLYDFLYEHFEEDPDIIKEEFAENPLIFVPDTEKKYYSSKEVIWKDVSDVFGKNRVYIEKYYNKLKDFFVEKLGISEKPTSKDYADVLVTISEKDEISEEDKKIIIKIYEELNRNLNPDKVENPISKEDWWDDLVEKSIFFTIKGEFWSNDGDIFIKDNNELYELFKNEEDIAFLWLPEGYHPDKIKFFIKSCGLHYLSESVEIKPLIEKAAECPKDEKHTALIQKTVPYVLRYLYWKENENYERLKEGKILQRIGVIEVYLTDRLRVKYSIKINDWKTVEKEAKERCIYHDGKLFKKNDASIYELAVEFSKAFGEIRGLDDFVMILMNDILHAEDIMKAKNIGIFPPEENEILRTLCVSESGSSEKIEIQTENNDNITKEKYEDISMNTMLQKAQKRVIAPLESIETISKSRVNSEEKQKLIEKQKDAYDKINKRDWEPEYGVDKVPITVETYDSNIQEKKIGETPKKEISRPYKESSIPKSQTQYAQSMDSSNPKHTDSLSEKAKRDIGRWGEEYALRAIRHEYESNEKYKNAYIIDTEQGFKLEENGNIIVEVIWLNKNRESKEHYDIKIVENSKEIFVEVKSTKEQKKDWFQVSKDQWRLMKEKGDEYYIYRIYGAGTNEARIEKIQNPAKLWSEGRINAYPIGIEI